MTSISPCLWFDHQAEEAVQLYTSLFADSKVGAIARYPEAGPGEAGTVMTIEFELAGRSFIALNGGPRFPFTEAISLSVAVETQEEADRLWDALTEGGEESQCGWLKDRYGLSWQIVPTRLVEILSSPEREKADRAMKAMLQMRKIDIAEVERAYEGI